MKSEPNLRSRLMEITPKYAEQKLAELQRLVDSGVFRQRPINKNLVETYASEMIRGTWGISHQGIGFDEAGRLLDGQHRLWAVIKAGIPVTMLVVTGIPQDTNGGQAMPTLDIIDRGRNRSTGQQLHIVHGISNASQVAACIRNIAYIYSNDLSIKMSFSQILQILKMYERDIESIFSLTDTTRQKVGTIIAPMAVYHHSFPDKAREYARGYFTKEGLLKGSPILAMIKYVENHPSAAGKEAVKSRAYVGAYCIHQYHHDIKVDHAESQEEAMYWLAALDKKHGELIRKMLYPFRKH